MKDILRRSLSIILPLGGLGTIVRYMTHGMSIVKPYVVSYQYYVIGFLAVIFLAFLIQFGIMSLSAKWLKVRAVIMGLVIILMGYYFIANDANQGMYAGDIIIILGVLLFYLPLAGLIVTESVQKKIQEKKQTIIEV